MQYVKTDLLADYNLLIEHSITVKYFVDKHWDRFIGVYCSITKEREDGDLYISLTEWLDKMLSVDVTPVFLSDGQLFNYFRKKVFTDKMKSLKANVYTISIDDERTHSIPDPTTYELNICDELTLTNVCTSLSDKQSRVILLLNKGYTRKQVGELLGITFDSVNNIIWHVKPRIQEICNN